MTDDNSTSANDNARELLAGRIREMLAVDPEAAALFFQGRTYSWGYYSRTLADLDRLLADHPDARRVGVVLRNRPGPMAVAVATVGSGRELVTLSPHLGDVGLAKDIVELAPDLIVAEPEDWSRAAVLEAAAEVKALAAECLPDRALAPKDLGWAPAPTCRPQDDVAVLMMTSGTTGHPKRVELTYDRLVASFTAAGILPKDGQPRHLRAGAAILWASLAHISGLYFVISHVVEGRSVALLEKFDVDEWAEIVRRHRPGYVRLAPAALRMVMHAGVPADTFESIRAVGSGTAPLPPDLAEAFEERYGVPVLSIYGATEFAGAIAGWTLKDKKAFGKSKRGSVGRAFHGIDLRVIDDEGRVLASDELGLLQARGNQLAGSDGEWITTTDLATIDADGFLFIHGRADDAINRGGFKIPPSVIEDVLREHPAVDEASVVGLPDERLGEVPAAAVTLIGQATEEELMEYLASRLTRYQRPVVLKVVRDLPRTPSLKVSRPLVREQYFGDNEPSAI